MAGGKFTRTQEKQYTGWAACPPVGTQLAGTALATSKDKPWVLSAPDGVRVLSAKELSENFLFKTQDGTEPINGNTAKAKMSKGFVDWTQVVRNTANALPIMARHLPSTANNGLGHFEIYPEAYGPQYLRKVAGNVFVRMFNLQGGLRNIATPSQAAAVTPKPSVSIASLIGGAKKTPPSYTSLPLPQGMRQDYGEALSKFYAEIKAEAKSKYNTEVKDGKLFNSGYLGLVFYVDGNKFNLYNSHGAPSLILSSTDFKEPHHLSSDLDKALTEAKAIFYDYLANPRVKIEAGTVRDLGSNDYTKFENCVTAELLETGILLRVKKGVSPMDLLRFPGFTGEEVLFKYEGPFNSYGVHNMLVGFSNGGTWTYSWGSSTTMTSEAVWRRNRAVVAAMEKLTGKIIYSK